MENQGQPSLFQEGSSPISHLCDEGCFSNNEDNHTSVLLQPPSPGSRPPQSTTLPQHTVADALLTSELTINSGTLCTMDTVAVDSGTCCLPFLLCNL